MPSRSVSTLQRQHFVLHTFTDLHQSKQRPSAEAASVRMQDELVRVVQTEIQEHKAQLDAAFM